MSLYIQNEAGELLEEALHEVEVLEGHVQQQALGEAQEDAEEDAEEVLSKIHWSLIVSWNSMHNCEQRLFWVGSYLIKVLSLSYSSYSWKTRSLQMIYFIENDN